MSTSPKVTAAIAAMPIRPVEKSWLLRAVNTGADLGYGHVIATLAMAWAVDLRDNEGLDEEAAIAAVRNLSPYPLPK